MRELRAEADWIFNPVLYRNLTVPTLLLTGSESVQITRDGTSALHGALPNSRIVVLEGQGHVAVTTAPELFVGEVVAFLNEG
jgi:pimeloyl-ACP methyl ester carboxylesterase